MQSSVPIQKGKKKKKIKTNTTIQSASQMEPLVTQNTALTMAGSFQMSADSVNTIASRVYTSLPDNQTTEPLPTDEGILSALLSHSSA